MYSVSEVAEKLNLSPATIRRLVRLQIIEGVQVGRQYRIPHDAIIKFITPNLNLSKGETNDSSK